jgi:hypothetical protein
MWAINIRAYEVRFPKCSLHPVTSPGSLATMQKRSFISATPLNSPAQLAFAGPDLVLHHFFLRHL